MTAYTPHTPPMWRRVFSLPHSRLGWWAVGLSAVGVVLLLWVFLFAGFSHPSWVETLPLPDPNRLVSPPWLEMALTVLGAIMVLVVPLASGVVGSLALGAGERSLLVWFAQVPAALFCFGLLNVFHEGSPWGRGSVGVLVWAVIAFSLIYLRPSVDRRVA
jgi:hypothetical protein